MSEKTIALTDDGGETILTTEDDLNGLMSACGDLLTVTSLQIAQVPPSVVVAMTHMATALDRVLGPDPEEAKDV